MNNKQFVESKYYAPVLMALLLLAGILIFISSHRCLAIQEERVAQEIGRQQQLIEDQKRMKIEIAMLKSRQRIEAIAKYQLKMDYPEKIKHPAR